MDNESKIFVAGHNGLVGSAIVRNLESKGFTNIITMDRIKLDLTKLHDVQMFFAMEQPDYVFLAAAKVGGIGANAEYPADFIYENLMIQTNVISSAAKSGVKKFYSWDHLVSIQSLRINLLPRINYLAVILNQAILHMQLLRLQVLICVNLIVNSMVSMQSL